MGMVIDCEPIIFNYNNKTYMIELWKGQYDLSTGAEIGIYEKIGDDPIMNSPICACASEDNMLQMSYTLKKNGNEVFSVNSDKANTTEVEKHWWLTALNQAYLLILMN
jgi:hypothetical protein